jgi:4-hydroxyphenylacetate 3-monooxygenase
MDEMDCVAIFDHVMVPWERVFVARDVALVNGLFVETGCMNQIMHQFAIKNLAKAEFLLGVALNMCDVVNSRADNVQNLLAEMINTVELMRAAIRAAEVDHVPGPAGTVLPNAEPLWTVRLLFPQLYPRLVEIVQMLGSSNLVMMPSRASGRTMSRSIARESASRPSSVCGSFAWRGTCRVRRSPAARRSTSAFSRAIHGALAWRATKAIR